MEKHRKLSQLPASCEIYHTYACFRLDDIACDAELQEKSESELKKIAETLKSGCEQAIKDFNNKQAEDTPNDGKTSIYSCPLLYSWN